MDTELYIREVQTLRADQEPLADARRRLPDGFPTRAPRRMTHLGTLMARVLAGRSLDSEAALLYGTSFAEVRSLEAFVDSFPNPSPLLFQGSIHPSAIQQVFVHQKIPIGTFIPITGNARMIGSLFENALLVGADGTIVCGGEERGSWMLEKGIASSEAFGWAFLLSRSQVGATGTLKIEAPGSQAPPETLAHARFFSELERRLPLIIPRPSGGLFRLEWE